MTDAVPAARRRQCLLRPLGMARGKLRNPLLYQLTCVGFRASTTTTKRNRDVRPYPFILLNLAFSLQAAYAAPLILLAQTRQADRDKPNTEADARHREELARTNLDLLKQNTELTEEVARLSRASRS